MRVSSASIRRRPRRPGACSPCSPAPTPRPTSSAAWCRSCRRIWAARKVTARPARSCRAAKVRGVGDRVAFVVAETEEQARDAAELIEVDYEPLAGGRRARGGGQAGRAGDLGRAPEQCRGRPDDGQQGRDRRGLRQAPSTWCRSSSSTTASAPTRSSRARRSATIIPTAKATRSTPRRRIRTAHRAHVAGDVLNVPQDEAARHLAGRRRRLRHEGRRSIRKTRWCCGPRAAAAAGRSNGCRRARKPSLATRTGATRSSPASLRSTSTARLSALRVDALHAMGSHVFGASMVVPLFALKLAPGVYQIPAVLCRQARRAHQHAAAGALSRRRPAGSDLSDRAAARPRGARARHRSDRAQAAQLRPAERDAAQATVRHRLRQRRLLPRHGRMPQARRLERLSQRAAESKKNGKLRGRGIGYFLEEAAIFNDRMEHALRSERHAHDPCRHAFARPGPCHRLRADGARMARRAVREHPLHSGRHQRGADRPRHLRLAQHACRRQRAASARPTPSSRRRSRWRR